MEGLTDEETIHRIVSENLFQYPTEKLIRSQALACLKRLHGLNDDSLVAAIATQPSDTAKQVCLYAMMKYNRVVYDFMITVIGEKFRTQAFDFSQKDLNVFFNMLQEQNDTVASWSDSTIKKIKQVLVKTLVECGYLDSKSSAALNNVSIGPELEDEIRAKNDLAVLPAFNCFR